MAEVIAGKLAASKGTTDAVRDFGMMMVKDHGAANKKLADLAKSKNIQLPQTAGPDSMATMKSLQVKDGPRFDAAYLADQVKAHEAAVQLLESEISGGQDAEAKALAQEMLPTVKAHLDRLHELTGQASKAANSGG
jgi:putative membrane protein